MTAGQAVIVYGDFTVSPGSANAAARRRAMCSQDGETLILDYSVVLFGYRSDFTNTLVVGGKPTPEQQRKLRLCLAAMTAGERELRAGASCLQVYRAVNGVFEKAKMADHFRHHAGHGLGLTHPESPYLRTRGERNADGRRRGDPRARPLRGRRRRHAHRDRNYLITETGFETLSGHEISPWPSSGEIAPELPIVT